MRITLTATGICHAKAGHALESVDDATLTMIVQAAIVRALLNENLAPSAGFKVEVLRDA